MKIPPAIPSCRPRSADSARIADDVDAYLARGGRITQCPTGIITVPEIASLRELVQDEFDVARAKVRVRRTRERGNRHSVLAQRSRKGV